MAGRREPLLAARVAARETELLHAIDRSVAASEARRAAWLLGVEKEVYPRIRDNCDDLTRRARAKSSGAAAAGREAASATAIDVPLAPCPPEYEEVLRLLREADASGNWPSTSRARARVLSVEDAATGGSFSLAAPGSQTATAPSRQRADSAPRGNVLFGALTDAVFALERAIAPNRAPSTMVAVNRRATFQPHTDAGAGAGQSTSLIVGLGDYTGGELAIEGRPSDIRYTPVSFDGWRERHWTLPFEGERFSLVYFTPRSAEEAGESRYAAPAPKVS